MLGVRRAHVLSAMCRAGVAETKADAMYRSLGWGVFELCEMLLSPRRALGRVELDERAVSLLESGAGVVVATAHTGNWDLAACAAAERVPLTVVTKSLSIGWLDWLWQSARRRRGVKLVGRGQAAAAAARALRSGEAVAMLIDQAPERERAITVAPFLAERAAVDLAPALVAMRARVPLALVLARRLADGSHVAELVGVIEPPARPSRVWAERAMQTLTAWLEVWIRRSPEQWLWMHRRWKQVPESVVACERRWTPSRGETAPASRTAASP